MNELILNEPTASNGGEEGGSTSTLRLRINEPAPSPSEWSRQFVSSVPTPTAETYHKNLQRRAARRGVPSPAIPAPISIPAPIGPRVLQWKQDPFVSEIGVRKAFLTGLVRSGPRDARITMSGPLVVSSNAFGDYIEPIGSDQFDWVHTFSVVRQTLTMYQRLLRNAVPWEWNGSTNTDPITVFPHAGVTPNAFYSRNQKALKFFFFDKPSVPAPAPKIFTCRSLDIVAHETGHAVLDGLKPGWLTSTAPQTGALHESFGDLTAIFVMLSQMDQVEALIAQSKANLHEKNFLAELAEEFGNALGRPNGLRNADNDLKLSQVGTEVHDLSQVFTGGIYDVLADIYLFERNFLTTDPAFTLYSTAQYLCSLLIRAINAAPASNATFADVVNQMLTVAQTDGKPVQYRNFVRNRFTLREVVVSATSLNRDIASNETLQACEHISLDRGIIGSRIGCCGTMTRHEFCEANYNYAGELEDLKKAAAARR
jgi:hypothetical protein